MARVRSSVVEAVKAAGVEEFVIVELTKDGPKPVYDHMGQLLTFKDGGSAAKEAAARTTPGHKFQPRRVKDDGWREREMHRFATKEYQPLPWSDHMWWKAHAHIHGAHYPHVSQKNSVGLMAFTETEEKGSADIQTAIKPGKYLERYFSDVLDPYIIRDLSTVFSNKFEDNCLLFVDSADEFEELYTKGPSSCMSHALDKYASHIHPVRVYAAGDLKLAYMKRDGRIVARTLVFPERKLYSRVYGDAGRIQPLLEKAGYRRGPPVGAKMERVITWQNKKNRTGNTALVLPHIDDINYVLDEGDHLIVGDPNKPMSKNGIKLNGANGISEWINFACQCCGKEGRMNQMKPVYIDADGHSQQWCEECVSKKAAICRTTKHLCAKSIMVEMANGDLWWITAFRDRGFICSGNNKRYPVGERVPYFEVNAKGFRTKTQFVSGEYFKTMKDARQCKTCGVNVVGGDCAKSCKDQYAYGSSGLGGTATYATTSTSTNSLQWAGTDPRNR